MNKRDHILVVDDEPSVLITYRLILKQEGYEVSAAASSQDARTILAGRKVDLLLCDLSLEKQESGLDVILYGRSINPRLPSILFTGYASQDANEWAEQRSIPVLFKPIEIQQLLQTIRDLLGDSDEAKQASSF